MNIWTKVVVRLFKSAGRPKKLCSQHIIWNRMLYHLGWFIHQRNTCNTTHDQSCLAVNQRPPYKCDNCDYLAYSLWNGCLPQSVSGLECNQSLGSYDAWHCVGFLSCIQIWGSLGEGLGSLCQSIVVDWVCPSFAYTVYMICICMLKLHFSYGFHSHSTERSTTLLMPLCV